MKVLIMGPSGSGKSYYANQFKSLGLNAVDTDQIEGLSSWYDWQKKKVSIPDNADEDFLKNHEFLWDREFLKDYLRKNPDIFLFGASGNIFEMIDLFNKVYFLKVPGEVIIQRLDHDTRTNPMGKTTYQKKAVLEWGHELERKAKERGIEFIDGTLFTEAILKLIS